MCGIKCRATGVTKGTLPHRQGGKGCMLGMSVPVVEDSHLMASVLEGLLIEAGAATVSSVACVTDALEVLRRDRIDFACLDINLGAETSFPVADELALRGIPFLFLSGYPQDRIPEVHRQRPFLSKTVADPSLIAACCRLALPIPPEGLPGMA